METKLNFIVWLPLVIIASVAMLGSLLGVAYVKSPISSIHIGDYKDMKEFGWANATNTDLQRGRRISPELDGPESITMDSDGNWYTGPHDGRVIKIVNPGKKNQTIIDLTKKFDFAEGGSSKNKRPLALRLHGSKLYVADAYQGIIMIDIKTGEWNKTVAPGDVSPPLVFADDLTITSDGTIMYFTDMSLKWDYEHVGYSLVSGECSGRIFKVELLTKRIELVKSNLCLPNGIDLDRNESTLIVSEITHRRIAVIDLKTYKIVRYIFLPAGGDNVRKSKTGGYWMSMPYLIDPNHITTWHPAIRNIFATMEGHEGLMDRFNFNQGAVIKFDDNLNPVSIHLDLEGKLSRAITEVLELDDGRLVLGSFIAKGIAIVDPLP